jgi:hypothetical protein
MKLSKLCCIVVTASSLLPVIGCSGEKKWERPKLVRASGVARYNGQPLEGAYVTLTNPTTGLSAYGRTDAEGKFTLSSFEPGDGAAPGKYQVSVSKVQLAGPATAPVDRAHLENAPPPVRRGSAPPEWRWLIPKRYGSEATSGLTVEVPESGSDTLAIELHGPA